MYFTFDQNDLNHNVDAWIVGSSFPNPYGDFDDDSPADGRNEEAEVVSESTSFPTANTTYSAYTYWSHWYYYSGAWRYDSGGGQIEFVANLSGLGCPFFCDKYDTHCCNANLNMNRSYPFKAQSQASTTSEAVQIDAHDPEVEEMAVPEGRSYRARIRTEEPNEIHLQADLARGVPGYARKAWGLARAAAGAGNAEGVITFGRPLTWEEFRAVEATGVLVDTLEVVSHPDDTGLRWSFVAKSDTNTPEAITTAADDAGVEVIGIVSATVTVPNVNVLKALEAMESVYLVDLSIADFKRHNPGVTDVTQNDVYWHLAGWD